jgi:hypothetical protein
MLLNVQELVDSSFATQAVVAALLDPGERTASRHCFTRCIDALTGRM